MKKLERNHEKRLLTPRKIRKKGKTHSKKEKKKEKILERERSFLNRNAFLSVPLPANFCQCTSLAQGGGHPLVADL